VAIDVDWYTGTITVPKADTTLVSLGPPEIRSFDVAQFKTDLKDLEASTVGQPWTDTHIHRGELVVSGFTYARSVIIIDPYRVEFEDGQYVVQLFGANHNIADVNVKNQVSLVVQNSAGLIRLDNTRGTII